MSPFINYAHRGASAVAPENTLAAFMEALNQGADGIECDIQITRDGIPVVIHDESLARTTNGFGLVSQHTFAELQALDAGSWFHMKYAGSKIPALEEVLHWIGTNNLRLNIELKPSLDETKKLEQRVLSLIHHYKMNERTVISSYDARLLHSIRKISKLVETAYIHFFFNEPWDAAKSVGARAIHFFYPLVTEDTIQQAKAHHMEIVPYTVDEWSDISRMLRYDIQGIITNYPNRVRKFLSYSK